MYNDETNVDGCTEETTPNRLPSEEYEIEWMGGIVERVRAPQVMLDRGTVLFHGYGTFDRWCVLLTANLAEVRCIRNITQSRNLIG